MPAVAPHELRAALGERALVEYVDHAGELLAVTVANGRTRLRPIGRVTEVAEQLDALRFGLRSVGYQLGSTRSAAAAVELVERRAERLDRLLLHPIAADLGDRELVIVPTGVLHAMPWPVLPGCANRPVSVAPSAALWHRALRGPAGADGRRVFVAGPGLPHASAEVVALARRRAALRFTGRRARVDEVMAALDGAELGHIAAHGSFRADNPLFSALHLEDGPLTVYDLERLDRPPRHLVLSACDSGLPAVHPGDELLGLAAALLGLGSRSLVATVVPVPDRTSRPLMLRLHRHLDRGLGPAAALNQAQRDVARHDDVTARVTALGFVCFGAG
jgi:CHAT domain-containing protein